MLAVALATQKPAPAAAQVRVVVPGAAQARMDGELPENVFLPAERTVLQRLSRARELLEQGRHGEAVRYLGAILDGPEDFFFQLSKDAPVHRSLKGEARRLIGRMPPKGRELYELQYGARARQMLAEAISAGDRNRLADASRQFFHTRAGYEATLLLGLDHLDHGRPLAAALTLQGLRQSIPSADPFEPTLSLAAATSWLQAGSPDKARAALATLKQQGDGRAVTIGGRQVPWFTKDAEATAWLVEQVGPQHAAGEDHTERWAMFRGSPSRNAASSGGGPLLNVRWRVPIADGRLEEQHLQRLQRGYLERGMAALPGLHPLVVDDVVLIRTMRELLAVDFRSGKRLWLDGPDVIEGPWETVTIRNNANANPLAGGAPRPGTGLEFRVWDDAAYGTLSSDGRLVFSIEGLDEGIIGTATSAALGINRMSSRATPTKAFNRLSARDIHTGRLKWHLGGPADEFALPQAETFFLGPPLPLTGQLYVLAEVKGEIRLLALDAQSGNLLWSQQLAVAQRSVLSDRGRRLAGASPSYSDGILVCPTSAGAVVAVELATRSLLWGFRYKRPNVNNRYSPMLAVQMARYPVAQQPQRWRDATACIAEGRVLVSPVEWDTLHCLSLIDGEHLWEYRRQDDLYVACVHRGNVVLAGRRGVRALSLHETEQQTETVQALEIVGGTGRTVQREIKVVRPKPAWGGRTVALPEGSMPSGRGFRSGDRYFLPLSSAQVMAIDLVAGKAVSTSKSRKGNVPGNLVCYKGKIISQSFDGVENFYQLDAARREADRRLAQDGDDPEGLSLQAEILLEEGEPAEAIALLRRAYDVEKRLETPVGAGRRLRTRELLRDALLRGLQTNFAAYRDRAEEIEQLIDDSGQRAKYLRLMASGLRQQRQWQAALDHYLKLIDLDGQRRQIEPISSARSVRSDRLIRAEVATLRSEADDEAAAAIDRVVEARMQTALQEPNLLPLQRFLDYFGDHPAADKVRRELFRRLKNADQLLQAELLLWPQQRSPDPEVAGPATAELAEMLHQAKRPEDAAVCYRRLGREFSDVVCLGGKTGKELFEALPDDGPVKQALNDRADWPSGKVEVTISTASSTGTFRTGFGRQALLYHGSRRPFFSDTTLYFDQSTNMVLGDDALGKTRWKTSLVKPGARSSLPFRPRQVQAQGHLLLLSVGYGVLAIDTLGPSDTGQPEERWSQDLTDLSFELAGLGQLPAQLAAHPWAWQHLQWAQSYGSINPSVPGPITSRYVCLQRYRDLVVTDPLNGELLWIRRDVPAGSRLFGDDRFIFAAPPSAAMVGGVDLPPSADGHEALVFRATDGKLLGTRPVPPVNPAGAVPSTGTIPDAPATDGPTWIGTLGRQILVWRPQDDRCVLELFDPWQQRQVWPPREFAGDAKYCLVGDEAIGVFAPEGRFLLLSLPDGQTIAQAELEPETDLSEIFVFASGDQYVLVTHSPQGQPTTSSQQMTPALRGTTSKPIYHGRVYSFGPDGKVLWPKPAEIQNQHLLLNQPGRLPVLTFACRLRYRTASGSLQYGVSTLFLDKRTGRTVYAKNFEQMTTVFELAGDPESKTVELTLNRQRLTMKFTDEPIGDDSDEDSGDQGG